MKAMRRLPPAERERHIVEGAIDYFARHGMDAQMRDLAAHLGISHPLFYRYFATKEALIERVYGEFYASRWHGAWDGLLRDETLPLAERLTQFYAAYLRALEDGPWLRIFAFSGLRGEVASQHYMAGVRDRIITPIAMALDRAGMAPRPYAMELAWALHGELCFGPIAVGLLGLEGVPLDAAGIRRRVLSWLSVV